MRNEIFKKLFIIVVLTILNKSYIYGQAEITNRSFDYLQNIELTRKVCEIIEIKNILLTRDANNKESVFVYLNTDFFNIQIFDKNLSTPFYIWYKKTFFFHQVDYWLLPISIEKKFDMIYYSFRTCSFVKDENRNYYEGEVIFSKIDNEWQIDTFFIEKTEFKCDTTD